MVEGAAHDALSKIISGLTSLQPDLDEVADEHADRSRCPPRAPGPGPAPPAAASVTAQRPVDVLSVQLLLPEGGP